MTTPAPVAVEPTKDSGKIEFDKKIKIGQFLDRSRANETRENIKRREAFTQFGKGERGRERANFRFSYNPNKCLSQDSKLV